MTSYRRISEESVKDFLISPQEAARIGYDFAEKAYKKENIGFSVGFKDLDDAIPGGIKAGDVCVIGARPGSGKSFLVNSILSHTAKNGATCLLASLEMTAAQLGVRGFSYFARIDSKDIFAGEVHPEAWGKIVGAAVSREELPIWLLAHRGTEEVKMTRRPPFTINMIDTAMSILHDMGVRVEMVGIDYLQRVKSDYGYSSRKDIADEASAGAKDIALKYGAAVILASQLGRQVDDRTPQLPTESDYKESGNIEEDADICMSMFYPFKYYQEGDKIPGSKTGETCSKNKVFVRIHKQRGGDSNVGTWLYFDPRFAMIADLEERLAIDW